MQRIPVVDGCRTALRALCAVAGLWLLLPHARAGNAVPVRVPTAGVSSAPQALHGMLFRPQQGGNRPAVIMVHGCGGAYARSGALGARHQAWGELLSEEGYVVLMLDSFTARDIREICTVKYAERNIKESDRVGDAYAALHYMRQLAGVDPQRIALLGWSHGGGLVLDAVSRQPVPEPAFRAAVSFYPGCTARNRKAAQFRPYAPLLLLIGEADDWTPAQPCKALAATVAEHGGPMQIVSYPGAYHDFDNPGSQAPRRRMDVPNGVSPGSGVMAGPDPAARADAQRRVRAFLKERLQ